MAAEGRELGWDDSIQEDSKEFIVLPEGDYEFTIESFERGRSKGQGKLPPCNMAIVTFIIHNPHGEDISVNENYLLHSSMEWKLSELFSSVGLKQKGEQIRMNWGALPGSKGRCSLIIHKYDKNGEERKINRIKSLYPYEPKKFEAGRF